MPPKAPVSANLDSPDLPARMNASGDWGRHARGGARVWMEAIVNAHRRSGQVALAKLSACATLPTANAIANFAPLQYHLTFVNSVTVTKGSLVAAFPVLQDGKGIPAQMSAGLTAPQSVKSANVRHCGATPPALYPAPKPLFKMEPMPMAPPSWCHSYAVARGFARMAD